MGIWQNRKPWQKGAIAGFGVAVLIGAGAALPFIILGAPVVLAALVAAPFIGPVVAAGIAALGIVGAVAVAGLALAAIGIVAGILAGALVGKIVGKSSSVPPSKAAVRYSPRMDDVGRQKKNDDLVDEFVFDMANARTPKHLAKGPNKFALQEDEQDVGDGWGTAPIDELEITLLEMVTSSNGRELPGKFSLESILDNTEYTTRLINLINDVANNGKIKQLEGMNSNFADKMEGALHYYALFFIKGYMSIEILDGRDDCPTLSGAAKGIANSARASLEAGLGASV